MGRRLSMQDAEVAKVGEAIVAAMTKLNGWESKPLPKPNRCKGLSPLSWIKLELRVEHTDAGAEGGRE